MATIPQDATHDVQQTIAQLNDEIASLRSRFSEFLERLSQRDAGFVTEEELAEALQSPKFLDFRDVFRASGPAHGIGYVPSDGRWMSGAMPEGHERVLREDAVWRMPAVQGPYAIQADETHDKHTLNGSLHVAGALASSRLMTGPADIFGPVLIHGEVVMSGLGLPSGSCYGNSIAWTQASAVQNTWYPVSDSDMTDGTAGFVGITHDGSGELTVTYGGRYLLGYGISVDNPAGAAIEVTPRVDGTEAAEGRVGVDPTGAAQHALASTTILKMDPSSTVELSIRTTDSGTPTLGVEFMTISLVLIGGEI
jgi:hypothetical protein